MEDIYIVGTGMTPFGRHLDLTIKQLSAQAVDLALRDAGVAGSQIQAAFFGNAVQGHMEGQHSIRGQIALRSMGLGAIPVVNIENACATGSSAFSLAVNHLKAGEGEIALALGAEKMFSHDRERMFSAFDAGWDVSTPEINQAQLMELGKDVEVPPGTMSEQPYSVFMDIYAAFARQRMRMFGITQRQLAVVCSKNHAHSVHNPLAQFRKPFSVEEVLASPPIAYPLTRLMCSPISDGAAAAVLATGSAIKRLGLDRKRAVRVRAMVVQTGTDRAPEDVEKHVTVFAARRAYEKAGVGPDDMDVAEVHDATAMGELIQIENLGFCNFGEGGIISERGDTALGGRIPVNPSGGLESKGHPVGATGIGQLHELVTQLRGEAGARQVPDARFGIAENGGGLYGIEEAVATVAILER
jgi:acetyl-CoA acetyltransferase